MTPSRALAAAVTVFAVALGWNVTGQGRNAFIGSFKDPAINYEHGALTDAVTTLSRQLEGGTRLAFEPVNGYLRSVLAALDIPVESQVLVFSQTSLQAPKIGATNPRAIYFNDHVAVAWVRGGPVLEIASHDPRQGIVFYSIDQQQVETPRFERRSECLRCHISWETLAVPGTMVLSTGPDDAAGYATGGVVDHRDEIRTRWGHWYLTGRTIPGPHMGVAVPTPPGLASRFDLAGYLAPHSDVVALMVLEHQTHAMNLITYLGWEARVGASQTRIDSIARDLVDYLLFVDEAPLRGPVAGSSGFAERFASVGPRDSRGRSLRQFDLERRLMKYPCSYMIYSAAFDALPERAKTAVFARLLTILSGGDSDAAYRRLARADRQAVTEILRETKTDFARLLSR